MEEPSVAQEQVEFRQGLRPGFTGAGLGQHRLDPLQMIVFGLQSMGVGLAEFRHEVIGQGGGALGIAPGRTVSATAVETGHGVAGAEYLPVHGDPRRGSRPADAGPQLLPRLPVEVLSVPCRDEERKAHSQQTENEQQSPHYHQKPLRFRQRSIHNAVG